MRWILLFSLLLIILPGVAIAQDEASPIPVIIDTDFAADDWMAILYLLQHPGVEVQAITLTGAGEAHCNPGVQNALNLLELAGQPDIPVACGRETPLEGYQEFPREWRTSVDAMIGLSLPESDALPYDGDAVALLRETIAASDQPPTLVTLGPLTNIAELFAADPALTRQLAQIVIMGGAVDVPGNVWLGDGSAEWNVYVDPTAAEDVFASGVPITLVPLDATDQAPITRTFVEAFAHDRTTPAAEFVYQVLNAQSDFIDSGTYFFWDPLAAAVAADPTVVTLEERTLHVEPPGRQSSGRLLSDESGVAVSVAVAADAGKFEQVFRNVLNGRPADAPLPGA